MKEEIREEGSSSQARKLAWIIRRKKLAGGQGEIQEVADPQRISGTGMVRVEYSP